MTLHPLLVSVTAVDILTVTVMVSAGITAIRIRLHWQPETPSPEQLRLESRTGLLGLHLSMLIWLTTMAATVQVLTISNVLPPLVPGAMCGTGVIQAAGSAGLPALIFRLIALVILYAVRTLNRINESHPGLPAIQTVARGVLLASPILLLAAMGAARLMFSLNTHEPVSCCAVVYDLFRTTEQAVQVAGVSESVWVAGFWILTPLVLIAAVLMIVRPVVLNRFLPWVSVFITLIWTAVSCIVLVRVLAAYIYRTLHHHCPWCLFLPEHSCAGFLLFSVLLITVMETMSGFVCRNTARHHPALKDPCRKRIRQAGITIIVSTVLFVILATTPALLWWWQYGVWMGR